MARFFLFLLCLVALHPNHFVIGTHITDYIISHETRDGHDKQSFSLSIPTTNNDIAYCEFKYSGVGGIMNIYVSKNETRNERELTWECGNGFDANSRVFTADTKIHHYGKYEIEEYSSNGTLLITAPFNLYKKFNGHVSVEQAGYLGEYSKISLNQSEILNACNLEENKDLCSKESPPTCKLVRCDDYGQKIDDDSDGPISKIKETGNCQFEIFLYNNSYNKDFSWNIEAYHGFLITENHFRFYGYHKVLEAKVGSTLTVHFDSPDNKNITCLSFQPRGKISNSVVQIFEMEGRSSCEFNINNVGLSDNGIWVVEYKYDDDGSDLFEMPYKIDVTGIDEDIEFSKPNWYDVNAHHFGFERPMNGDVTYCEIKHSGIGGTTNYSLSSGSDDIPLGNSSHGSVWKTFTYLMFHTLNATIDDYGKYECKGYSSNKTLLTTKIVNLFKKHEMEDNPIIVNGYYGEDSKISLNESEIIKVCDRKRNKGLCRNDSRIICKLYWTLDAGGEGKEEYYNSTRRNELEKKIGNCEYVISNLYSENQGFWHIEAWYGYMVIHRKYQIAVKFRVSGAE